MIVKESEYDEVTAKLRILDERLAGHEGPELGIALLFEGIHHLTQLGQSAIRIRNYIETVLLTLGPRVIRKLTKAQVAKILGGANETKL